jgi:hypothetical protein
MEVLFWNFNNVITNESLYYVIRDMIFKLLILGFDNC